MAPWGSQSSRTAFSLAALCAETKQEGDRGQRRGEMRGGHAYGCHANATAAALATQAKKLTSAGGHRRAHGASHTHLWHAPKKNLLARIRIQPRTLLRPMATHPHGAAAAAAATVPIAAITIAAAAVAAAVASVPEEARAA